MASPNNPTILFMGTPAFALASLKALDEAGYPILGVVTQPDTVAGRGLKPVSSACALYAREKNLRLFQPSSIKDAKTIEELKELAPDFIVVAAYGQFLPQSVLQIPKIDIVNVHGSLLPAYRGAAPIQYSILEDEKETGVSIMRVILKMDAGPVYSRVKVPIDEDDTTQTLMNKCALAGAKLLTDTLPQIVNGLKPVEQDEGLVTFSPSFKKDDGSIDWTKSNRQIFNQIRAFTPWPIAYTSINGKTLKIHEAFLSIFKGENGKPGTIYKLDKLGIHVQTGEGCITLKSVQLEGKKRMLATDFANGLRLKVNDTLG